MSRRNIDMLNGSLFKNVIAYTIPIILTGVLQLLFNAADLVIVGRFCGSISVAAVGATTSIINLIVNLFVGLSVGSGVAVAQAIGADDTGKTHRIVHTAIPTSLLGGIVLTVVGVFLSETFLTWMKTPDDVLPLSALYMKIYFAGIIFMMIYNFCAAILRAIGDTKSPLVFLTIAGVINVVLNVFFVTVFHLNVAGVALATTISQAVSAILVMLALIKRDDACKLHLSQIRFHKDEILQIMKVGLPAGIQGSLFSISNVIIQSSINSFGSVVMSGNAAALNIEGFVYIAMNSFCQSSVTFTGQSVGAKNYKLVKKALYTTLMLVSIVGITLGAAVCLLREPLMGLYSSNAEDIAAGMNRLIVICLSYFLCGLMEVTTGAIRGMGNSTVPMIITLIGACGMRIAWIYTVFRSWHTAFILYISYPISWTITFAALLMFAIHYRKRLERQDSERQKSALAKESSEVLKNNA